MDKVLAKQKADFGFGFAKALEYVPSLTVPVLYAQVEKDVYTFNQETGRNDIVDIMAATPTENNIVWIGPNRIFLLVTDKGLMLISFLIHIQNRF